jgi:hypothetical protein
VSTPQQAWTAAANANLVLAPPSPSSGDLMVAVAAIRPSASTLAPPSGWTEAVNQTATDGGAEGADTGSVRLYTWTKVADGTEGTTGITFTESGTTSVSLGQIVLARSATGTYSVAAAHRLNNGDVTDFGGALSADPGLTAGDLMLALAAQNGDLANSSAWALSATGVTTQSTWTEYGEYGSTTGNDVEVDMAGAMVLVGTSSAAPTLTCTMSAAVSGVLALLRIRQGSGTARSDVWLRSAGVPVAGTTSLAVPLADNDQGDRLVLAVVTRSESPTVTTPTDWTALGNVSGAGSGTFGADAGGARVSLFYRDVTATMTGTVTVAVSSLSNQVSIGQMFTLSKPASGTWATPTMTGGGDTTAGTDWSVTGAASLGFGSGDVVLAVSGVNTDAPTAVASPTLSASGVTFGTVGVTSWWETTTGNDGAIVVASGRVTVGATATPTHTLTFTGTTTNGPAGVTGIARLGAAIPVEPAVVAAVAAVPSATVTTEGGSATVVATVVTGAATVPAPAVTGQASATVAATVVTGTATVPTPTVTGQASATVAATVVTGTATVPTPTVTSQASATVAATVVTGTATVPTPTVSAGSRYTATVVTGTATVPTPTVTGQTSATVAATVVTGTATVPTPTVSAGSRHTATVVTGTATVPTPTVAIGSVVAATVVAGAATVPAPAVTGQASAAVAAAVVAGAATVPAADLVAGVTVAPTVTLASASVPSATLATTVAVAPSLLTLAAAVPSVEVQIAETVVAVAVATSATVEVPYLITQGSALVSPSTVAATCSVRRPTIYLPPLTVAAVAGRANGTSRQGPVARSVETVPAGPTIRPNPAAAAPGMRGA